jgi:multicomponent K+:H+ antiporter subunit A
MIVLAGLEADQPLFSALMIVNMVLSVVYYLRLIYNISLKEPAHNSEISERTREAPLLMLIPIAVLAALCMIIGLYPGPFIALAQAAANAILGL